MKSLDLSRPQRKYWRTLWALILVVFYTTAIAATDTTPRLRIENACTSPIWIFHTVGENGGTLTAPNPAKLAAKGDFIEFNIPDKGLAGTRFWPGSGCDDNGANCKIGQSGGPGLPCPAEGCAPPVDSKFEGTFGCLPSVAKNDCQINPASKDRHVLSRKDNWDTSMVDGFTLPYTVTVKGTCPNGPKQNKIDCSGLSWSHCPQQEEINGKTVNLTLDYPHTTQTAGCYSPCSKLTMNNWKNSPTYSPSSNQAKYYCCGGITPEACRQGVGASSQYVKNIHQYCPQTYAYAYDDGTGLFACPAEKTTKYVVTFGCPK
ncbi:MAG: hypothetical protein MI754_12035 [Chromatiales bacterium]|nr:hypothetical protein [Chromatiales bacterium]